MAQEDCRAELREKTHQLLHGALKHVRVAALATALVPLGSLAARPAVAQDCGSGGCPVTPTVEAADTPTDTPEETPTDTMTFTFTPADTETETQTPTPTDTPTVAVPDTATEAPTQTATPVDTATATPPDTATETPTDTAIPTNTAPPPDTETPVIVPNTATPPDTATPTSTAPPTSTASSTRTLPPTQTPTPTATPVPCRSVSIAAKFNRSAIAGGNCIWFNSVINPLRLGRGPTTIVIDNQTVRFRANGHPYTVSVPRAVVTFDRNVTSATTTFDPIGNQWVTEVPLDLDRDVFAAGMMLPVSSRLPGGIDPVTWSASFSSDADHVRLEWQWSAAVYTKCDTPLDALGVKPVDGVMRNPYHNADDAGTPESIKRFVIDGARGSGGRDFTGSDSRTEWVRPCD